MPLLTNNEDRDFSQYFAFNYQNLKDPAFLANLGATNEKIIGYIPAGAAVNFSCIYTGTAAAGANDVVATVGVTASAPTEFNNAVNISTLVASDYNSGSALINTSNLRLYVNNTTAAVPIYLRISAGTLANLTAGAWIIAWSALNPRRFALVGN